MNYRLSIEAANDLETIWLYTFETWSMEQADRYLNSIFDEIEYISFKPESALDYNHIRKDYFRAKVKSHFIFFKVNKKRNELEIIRILHEMMDIESHL
ncbi:type II toxin-antitoxin system RelE/ParE family toxin [Aequorivita nionensis]|jgi:toxin ParE1/3/4|uniref:type II toxin-antitoxin system RelE/ParE family toxin n=1 Tax=Aequorivita nionensis TaxID=1287690 RepID=UPI0039659A75